MKFKDLEKVALRNLKKDPKRKFQDPCLAVLELNNPQVTDFKKCNDPMAFGLLEWNQIEKSEGNDSAKENIRRKFLRQYTLYRLDQEISETNQALQGIWDLSPSLKDRSLTLDMMLALPEMQKLRQAAQKAYSQYKETQSAL